MRPDLASLLLADIDAWIQALVVIVPLAIGALGALFKTGKEAKPGVPPAAKPVPPQRRRASVDAEVARQLEEFRRRRRGPGRPPVKAPPATQANRPVVPQARTAHSTASTKVDPTVPAVKMEEPASNDQESIAEHVKRRMSRDAFLRRNEDLGTTLVAADAERSRHRHELFDHQVGELASLSTLGSSVELRPAFSEEKKPAAANIAQFLRDPGSIRRAIILNSILERPTDRWQ